MPRTSRGVAAALIAALALAGCSGGGGGGGADSTPPPPPPTNSSFTDPNAYSTLGSASLSTPNENVTTTKRQAVVNGVTLNYTATAGHMTALHATMRVPQASFFYVAYTLDGAAPATRPVTFFYNGGPGSATVWLHLGSFGPRRIATGAPQHAGTTPFPLVDNAETLLDVSDLVFVDAVGAGYSEAIAPNTNASFWSVDSDAAVFRDFVMRYVEVNNRGSSPKFLYGESYGGPRSGILASLLETAGVRLKGVILQSPAMDYWSNCDIISGNRSCSAFLPSYAATGAWHGFATPSPAPAQIPDYMAQMRVYATTTYDPAVRLFLEDGILPTGTLITQLTAFTGFHQWSAGINVLPTRFRANLNLGTLYGRYDARVAGPPVAGSDNDPSSTAISPSFALRIGQYLSGELGYTTPSSYTTLSNAIQSWDFRHAGREVPDTIPDLGAAMALNPQLKVLSMSGYHDIATPFYLTEQDLARLGANPNIVVRAYLGGHMTYLDDGSRVRQKADLVDFYRSAQ
jgi:carboxypeptidase C (cathepsin A)